MFDGFIKAACATPEIVVADCAHNAQKIIDLMEQAAQAEVKLLVFPELLRSLRPEAVHQDVPFLFWFLLQW